VRNEAGKATGAKVLGRQLRSDEPQARRPTEFSRFEPTSKEGWLLISGRD
jgi:hypothetical protein